MAIPFLQHLDLNSKAELRNALLHLTTSATATDVEGKIIYDTGSDTIKYYAGGDHPNGAGWVELSGVGDITGVNITAGNGLTGTVNTTSGPHTQVLDVVGGDGITANADEIEVTVDGVTIELSASDGTGAVRAKTAAVTNGGTALATGDQIFDFVDGSYLALTDTLTFSGGDVTGSGAANGSIELNIGSDTVEAAMLNDNIISGQTALDSGLVSTDELLVSDAGTIKRMDISVLEDYMQANLTFTNNTDTTYDFSLAAASSNSAVLTLDASAGDDDTVTFEGTTNEIQITTPATGDAGTIKIGLPDDVTIGNDLIVQGDLTVNGDTTTISTTNLNVQDALIGLQAELTAANTNDIGIIMERGSSGANAAFIWDESAGKFTLGTTTATAASTGSITVTAGTLVAALEGNATTATTLANSRDFSITGDITATAVSFNGSGNVELNASIDANVVGATELNVSGNGTAGQVLASDGDGSFSWVAQTTDTNTQLATAASLIDVSAMSSNYTASITHNLASKNLIVQLYDTANGAIVHADIQHYTNNRIDVTFALTGAQMVAAGIGDIRVVIIDAKNGLTDITPSYSTPA